MDDTEHSDNFPPLTIVQIREQWPRNWKKPV